MLSHLQELEWSLLAIAAAEERCDTVASIVGAVSKHIHVLRIDDPVATPRLEWAIDEKWAVLHRVAPARTTSGTVRLLADLDTIAEQMDALVSGGSPHILLDMTAMPKRWLFPAVRHLLGDARVETLAVSYTAAGGYGPQLAYDPQPIQVLPGFPGDGTGSYEQLVVAIGFAVLGLETMLNGLDVKKLRLMFPFPPGPPGHGRNWATMRAIERPFNSVSITAPDLVHVDARDCPQMFDILGRWTEGGQVGAALAPYGPKTMSLAMCLFSIAAQVSGAPPIPVYYAQPTRYAAPYSTGIKLSGARPDVQAYCLKLRGRRLYTLA